MFLEKADNYAILTGGHINGEYTEDINSFQYVGLLFTQTMSLYKMTEDIESKAKRILVALLNSLYEYGTIPKTVVFKLFDVKCLPILLYGSKLWGVKQFDCIERVHYYLCKRYMNVGIKASNFGVIGDCGRYPVGQATDKKLRPQPCIMNSFMSGLS